METIRSVSSSPTRNSRYTEDPLQEAVFKAYRGSGKKGRPDNLKARMMTVLRNTHINRPGNGRKEPGETEYTGRKPENFVNSGPSGENIPREEKFNQIVRNSVDTLPEKLRQVVILYYVDCFTCREISEILDVPRKTVITRLHNARNILNWKLQF